MRIIIVISIFLMSVLSVYAGETKQDKGTEAEKQIILAYSDPKDCSYSCKLLFSSCKDGCNTLHNDDKSICIDGCGDSYGYCIEKCYSDHDKNE